MIWKAASMAGHDKSKTSSALGCYQNNKLLLDYGPMLLADLCRQTTILRMIEKSELLFDL